MMDYFFEGIGNEFLLIVFAYLLCVCFSIRYFTWESCIVPYEWMVHLWHSLRSVIVGDDPSMVEASPAGFSSADETVIRRTFNTDCCVCLSDDYMYPVVTECGHCFCGNCAISLIERCSVPMKCPLCRQECRFLLPPRTQLGSQDDTLLPLVISAVNAYNSRAEHRFPFVNRVRNAPVILRHLMRSFGAVRVHIMFRLKCHVVAAIVIGISYLVLSSDIIPESVFGLIGFLDDILVIIFLSVLIARTYASLDSPITFMDNVLAFMGIEPNEFMPHAPNQT